jgi:two-component system, NtrC family, sensor kinase
VDTSINIAKFYKAFRDISTAVHSSADVREVTGLAVRLITDAIKAKGAVLRILNLETDRLELNAAYGLSDRYLSKGHVSSRNIISDLCRQNRIVVVDDIPTNPRVQYKREAQEEGISMMLDVPLSLENNIIGIIRIFFGEQRSFSNDEMDFLVSIAEQCALAIEKARLIEMHKIRYDNLALHTEKLSALGRMAAGIAHEINNPLGGILIYSTNLIKKIPNDGPLKEGMEIIIQETLRCKTIISDLLEFSREKAPQKIQANINEILKKTISMLRNEFRLDHINVTADLSEDVPDTSIDPNQMQQVFVNLMLNAVEAIRDKGSIGIRSCTDPPCRLIRIEITDDGCGIDPDNKGRLFEPFFTTKPKGTGLGLAVTYRIIRNHGGDIHVNSMPGKGTTFTIEMPVEPERPYSESERVIP